MKKNYLISLFLIGLGLLTQAQIDTANAFLDSSYHFHRLFTDYTHKDTAKLRFNTNTTPTKPQAGDIWMAQNQEARGYTKDQHLAWKWKINSDTLWIDPRYIHFIKHLKP